MKQFKRSLSVAHLDKEFNKVMDSLAENHTAKYEVLLDRLKHIEIEGDPVSSGYLSEAAIGSGAACPRLDSQREQQSSRSTGRRRRTRDS